MGLVLWKVKNLLHHPKLTLDLIRLTSISFSDVPRPGNENRFGFHTSEQGWVYLENLCMCW